jgi:Fe-S cluster assembly protein SufD
VTALRDALAKLPTTREEDWRYTDLGPLAERALVPATPAQPQLPTLPGTEQIAFVNGAGSGAQSQVPAFATPDGVSGLNAALATAGLDLVVPAGAPRAPLHLVSWFGGTANGHAHLRHRIRVAPGASLQLVVHELGDGAPFFATQVLDVELGANSQLDLSRLQHFGPATTALTRVDVRLGRDARFASTGLYAGGALVRNDFNVALDAPGAQAELHGVLAPAVGEHLDVHTRLDHRAPHGRSREQFRCIVPARAHAVFNGKVVVHRDAQKTDSEQHVDSLLLAPGAVVNAKPELQIDADDVKCAHGATCGQLDDDMIYYLRSRGLDLAAARNLLLYTFAHEVLGRIPLEAVRQLADHALIARLPQGSALGDLA